MDVPLGLAVGNALEVTESVEVLAGGGPADVVELTVAASRGRCSTSRASATSIRRETLRNGTAMDVWRRMMRAQGGDPDAPLPMARENEVVRAERDGIVTRMDAMGVGVAVLAAGCRAGPQGGPGLGRRRDPPARQARGRGGGRCPSDDAVHR